MAKRYHNSKKHHKGHNIRHEKMAKKMGSHMKHNPYDMSHKYHQTEMDRRHESEGMKHYWAVSKDYIGPEYHPERRMELEDSMMIHEDRSAPSNLPQHVVHKYYPKYRSGPPMDLDDTVRGVDDQIYDDDHQMMKHLKPEKY